MKAKIVDFSEVVESKVEIEGAKDVYIRWLVAEDDEAPNFYLRHFRISENGHTPYHKHNYEHEVFVLSGEGIAVLEDKEYPIKGGSVLSVPPNAMHQFKNNSKSDIRFLCIIPKIPI